jgi:hypothetical protein
MPYGEGLKIGTMRIKTSILIVTFPLEPDVALPYPGFFRLKFPTDKQQKYNSSQPPMRKGEEGYMNDVFENIYLRRSVRDYKPNDVPDDIIRELIRAGTYAPYAFNQP